MKKFKYWWLWVTLVLAIIITVILILCNSKEDGIDTKKMLGTYSNGEARITLKENGKCSVEVYDYGESITCKWESMGYFDGKDIGQDNSKYPWAKIYMNDGTEVELDALFMLNYTEFMDPKNLVKWEKQGENAGEANSGKLNSAISKTYEPTYDTSYSSEPDIPIDNGKTLEDAKMEAQMFVDAYKQEVTNRGYDYYEMLHQMGYADESEFFQAMVEKYMNEN